MAEPSGNPPGPPYAARSATHYACRRRLPPLAGDKIEEPAACAVPFRPYGGGAVTRTRNVSEYMLVLDLCLVVYFEAYSRVIFVRRSSSTCLQFSNSSNTVGLSTRQGKITHK